MYKYSIGMLALALMGGSPLPAAAASDQELQQIHNEIRQMKQAYEARIQALEARLSQAESKTAEVAQSARTAPQVPASAESAASEPASAGTANATATATATATAFNPAVSLILGGTYANLSQDPANYRLQGFMPGGEIGPGKRGANLGESELTLSASIDPRFAGALTFALSPDDKVSVEEAFFQGKGLDNGINLKAGRFLSSIGYLNSQHAHAWDFADAPLAYQAFLGGQYKADGAQLTWLAPTDRFMQFGVEAGRGATFPGTDRDKNGLGAVAAFAHVGDDIGDSASWRAGLSYLQSGAAARTYADVDSAGSNVTNAFDGRSRLWIADAIYKWAPHGNATRRNFKLQGEYFRRTESGTLTYDKLAQSLGTAVGGYASAQSGWYLQGVYQFQPMWRAGLRYDKLYAGTPDIGLVNSGVLSAADFRNLATYNPSRASVMLDYSPSEFSRFRIQFGRDRSRPEAIDNQLFLQYIMSLGVHGAHAF